MFTEIDGWTYLTDQYVMLPVSRLTELPVGYDQVLRLTPVPAQGADGMAEWMTTDAIPERPERYFSTRLIDPLEQAGFLIRPLNGVKNAHAICVPGLTVVGLLVAVPRPAEDPAAPNMRRAGA